MRLTNYEGLDLYVLDEDVVSDWFIRGDNLEPHIKKLIELIIKPNFNVVDAGCHLGLNALRFIKKTSGNVHCFDINSETIACIRKTKEANNLDNLIIYDYGLFSEDKEMFYNKHRHADQNSLLTLGSIKTNVIKLDTLNLKNIDVIKIDVEGIERDVVIGASNTIKKYKPILIVEHFEKHASPFNLLPSGYNVYKINKSSDYLAIHVEHSIYSELKKFLNEDNNEINI